MDAAPTSRPTRPRPWWLLTVAVVGTDLVISALIWFVVLAALPADVALGATAAMLAMSLVVVSGRAEGLAVRVLNAARRPNAEQAHRLAGPLALVAHRSGRSDLRLLVGGAEAVSAAGRRHVILHTSVLDALRLGRITDVQVAALIAHGVGRLRLGRPRLDLLVALWTIPWDCLRGLVAGVGRHLAWVPLGRLAWETRLVTASIAVVLEAQAGRWPSPIVIAVFTALSYLLPRWRRARHQLVATTAANYVAACGLDTSTRHQRKELHS